MNKREIKRNVLIARRILEKDGRLPAKYIEAALVNIENHSYCLIGIERNAADVINAFTWSCTEEDLFNYDFWCEVYSFLTGSRDILPTMPRIPNRARIIRVLDEEYPFYLYSNGDIQQNGRRIVGLKEIIRTIEAAWKTQPEGYLYQEHVFGNWRVKIFCDAVTFGCQKLTKEEAQKVFAELKPLMRK